MGVLRLFVAATTLIACVISDEGQQPRVSPRESVSAVVDKARITVLYGRPSKKGRVIFGGKAPVIAFGTIWRTGADEATQLRSADAALEFDGKVLPKKDTSYSVFTIPHADRWELIFIGQHGLWGSQFAEYAKDEILRVTTPSEKLGAVQEQLTILIDNLKNDEDGGEIRIEWDLTLARFKFQVQR